MRGIIENALVMLLIAFDAQNILTALRRPVRLGKERSSDYTILVPIYGHPRYLLNRQRLGRHKARTLYVVNQTTPELTVLADELEADGWGVCRVHIPGKISPTDMIKAGLEAVTTTYVIRLDGDAYTKQSINQAIGAMKREGLDLCSTCVVPAERRTLAQKMQGVEYDVAMLNRRIRPWTTSGACIFGRTDAMRHIMNHHSRWFYGEDIETGLVAKHFRMRVAHLPIRIYTDVPETFAALARQRRGWWAGHFRQSIVNFDHMVYYPALWAYNLILIYLMVATKWWSALGAWSILPGLMLVYLIVTVLANWKVRSRWMVLFPAYALVQSTVFPVIGVIQFCWMRYQTKRPARFVFRHRRETWVAA